MTQAPANSQPASSQIERPDLSVAICTWNRSRLLERTLRSFERLELPAGLTWELVLVNNNSSDDTEEVAARFAKHLPLRLVHESVQGHSSSRNAAVAAARGELLVWTDDDVQVDPNWLACYWHLSRKQPKCSFWGGTIAPDFEVSPPRWVRQNWQICSRIYALREWSAEPLPMDPNNLPFGANFAIRTDVQRQFPYNVQFGRRGSGMRGYDEIDVFRRLLEAGQRGAWCLEARVEHFVPADRLTLDYVQRYFRGQGETIAIRGNCLLSPGEIRNQLRRVWLAYYPRRWFRSGDQWLPLLIEASRLQGQLAVLGGEPTEE